MLSHRNMLANAAQAAARIDFGRQDKVFNVLPVFHSFGLTVGLDAAAGLRRADLSLSLAAALPHRAGADLRRRTPPSCSAPTRSSPAMRASAHSYDFRSLRYILAGAEPVKESTRRIYMEKFGLRILEGYGVTETAPALALNTPMFNKFGTVGRILPGMEARLEKVEGVDEGGRLFVRGPNVMLGYLRAENPGVLEPPPEGWHDTGDIVTIDEQGFITIKGRAKRFAKVGGEMISLAAVETLAAELWPDALSAVAAVPDRAQGRAADPGHATEETRRAREFQAFARSEARVRPDDAGRGHGARQAADARLRQGRQSRGDEIRARAGGGESGGGGISRRRFAYFRRNNPRRPPAACTLPFGAGFWMITSPCPVGNSRTA